VISTSDPESGITQFGYDARDNVSSVTDPRNHVTSYAYNGFDEPLEQTSPDTGLTTNTYDAAGNVVTSTDARGALSGYTYDALNRLTSAVYSRDGVLDQTVTYTYDAGAFGKGRRTGASDEDHSMQWVYDERGRVTSKTQTVSGVASTVSYAYTNGNLATIVTPSGQTIQYGYNTNGQVTSVTVNGTTVLSGVTYDPFGPVNGWTWGNGTIASRTFDTDGNVTAVSSGGRQRTYSHDDAFRITGVADPMTPSNSYAYGYDGLDRLTSAATSTTTRGWTYDATGNRLSETGDSPSSYTISGARNRVTSISGAVSRSYTYNAVGSVRTYEDATVTYSDHGRMRRFTRGTTTARFVYNALDQRVKRSGDGTGAVLYMYDEAGHLLGEYHGSGGLIQETVWLGDIPVATLRPGTPTRVFYVHTDHLNTPRKVTRPSDNKARWTWESDPFGVSLPNESPEGLAEFEYNLRFPGQIYDAHTKLMYNYFRDYDPVAGRYIQSDPIGLGGGINPYLYVGANPLSNVDPRGLEIYIPEGSANCWVNMLFDNRNNPRDTGRTQEQEEGVYRKERFVFPVIAPSVSIEPQEPKGRLEPVSVGFIVFWGLYRDTWLHRVYERSVTYDFICQDPCTGKIDATRGQGHDEVLGPPETFVRRNLIDTDVEFIPSQFPISPPSPVPRRGR
jgi:RHS repeat-associated protein